MWQAVAMVIASVSSLQLGSAIATTGFNGGGPMGVVWIRSVVGGGLLAGHLRPSWRSYSRLQMQAIVPFALALVGLNVFYYLALARLPLGVVSAIEMCGPLTVAALGRRGVFDSGMVGIAACGILLLSIGEGITGKVDAAGIAFALLAATSWALYIVLGKRVNERVEGLNGLAAALVISAIIQAPIGIAFRGPDLFTLKVLAAAAAAGVLSTLIPFSLEMTALRRLTIGTFGLLMALEPAMAAVFGLLIRGQRLSWQQILGILLVMVATAGILGPRWRFRDRYAGVDVTDPTLKTLSRVSLFDGLSGRELEQFVPLLERREAPEGTALMREGEEGDEFFLIESGEVEVSRGGRHIATLTSGDFAGEIALVFGGPRIADVVVTKAATILVLGKDDFDTMIATHPRIEDKVMSTITQRIRVR